MAHTLSRTSRFSSVPLLALATSTVASAQLSIATNLPGTFTDISGTGTSLSLADDASASITTTVGNALLPAGSVAIGSNGAVRFNGSSTALGFTNAALPSTGAFGGNQCLLPFWDDINTQSGAFGQIYWQEIGGVLLVGTWTPAGALMTVGSNVAGQGLVSQGGVLTIAGPNEALDNPGAGCGFDIRLAQPCTEFGVSVCSASAARSGVTAGPARSRIRARRGRSRCS